MMSIRFAVLMVYGGLMVGFSLPIVASAQGVPELQGCTNPSAINFTPGATIDNGSCVVLPSFPTFPVIPVAPPTVPTPVVVGTVTVASPTTGSELSGLQSFVVTFADATSSTTNNATYQILTGPCESGGGEIMAGSMGIEGPGFSVLRDLSAYDPGDYCFRVTVNAANSDEISVSDAITFSVTAPMEYKIVTGQKYEDVDGDGRLNYELDRLVPDYPIIATNNETGETLTALTDAEGTYSFSLPSGIWTLSEGEKRGWSQIRAYYGWVLLDDGEDEVVSQTCTFNVGERTMLRDIPRKGSVCTFLNKQVPVESQNTTGTKVGGRAGKVATPRVLGAATTTIPATASTTPTLSCDGMYLTSYLREGQENPADQVLKLQVFLNAVGITTSMTGIFDAATTEAVREFQVKYLAQVLSPWGITTGTGYVFKTTRAAINNMVCPGSEVVPVL